MRDYYYYYYSSIQPERTAENGAQILLRLSLVEYVRRTFRHDYARLYNDLCRGDTGQIDS